MSAVVADVVERVYRQARNAPWCPKPSPVLLRAVVEYVVDRVMHTRGELVSIPVAPVHRKHPRERICARCVAAWLGLEDCVHEYKDGRAVLRLPCVKERLGLV